MSNSFRKKAIHSVTCGGYNRSEKKDKQQSNRKLRRMVKQGHYDLTVRDVSDVWGFTKDGKCDWTGTDYEEKAKRK